MKTLYMIMVSIYFCHTLYEMERFMQNTKKENHFIDVMKNKRKQIYECEQSKQGNGQEKEKQCECEIENKFKIRK